MTGLQFTFQKTNGDVVTIGVTNTTPGTTIGTLAQNLVNLINANPALQSADGLFASDFYDYDNNYPSSPEVHFYSVCPHAGLAGLPNSGHADHFHQSPVSTRPARIRWRTTSAISGRAIIFT